MRYAATYSLQSTVGRRVALHVEVDLPLSLEKDDLVDRYVVVVKGDAEGQPTQLGGFKTTDLVAALGARGDMKPVNVWGPEKLYMGTSADSSEWGTGGDCDRWALPFRLKFRDLRNSRAIYELRPCDAGPDTASALKNDEGELMMLTIGGEKRAFLIAVIEAVHTESPPWSSFVVIEMKSGDSKP
jgi:hypothetical protein